MEQVFVAWEAGRGRRGIWNITQSFGNRDLIRGLVALASE
jgi:hypothetical protein